MALIHGTWEVQTVGRHSTGPSSSKPTHWGWVLSSDLTLESCAFLENDSLLFSVPPWVYLLRNKLGRHRKTHHKVESHPPHPSFFYFLSTCFVPKWKWKLLSRVQLFATPWTIKSMEFSRPEYWCGSPFPSPGDLPNPGIEPRSTSLQADSLPAEPQEKPKNNGVGSLSLLQQIFPNQE